MRKNARYYEFWREQHKQRVKEQAASRKLLKLSRWQKIRFWLVQSKNQIKGQVRPRLASPGGRVAEVACTPTHAPPCVATSAHAPACVATSNGT